MEAIFDTALPFFALIFCGCGAGRFSLLSRASVEGLNSFVFYFALPALLFSLMAGASPAEVLNGRFVAAYLGAGLVLFTLASIAGRLVFGLSPEEAVVGGASSSLGNTGYMGLPLVAAALGERAAGILVLGIVLEAVVIIPFTMFLIEMSRSKGSLRKRTSSIAGNLVRNPLIASILAGALFSASGLELPTPVSRFADLLGSTAGPCALFALGATLAAYRTSSSPGEVSFITSLKLLVHPAVMLLATTLLGVPPLWQGVALLASSLPVAANVFIVARQYDAYVERASGAVLVSTTVSIVTVSVMLALLSP